MKKILFIATLLLTFSSSNLFAQFTVAIGPKFYTDFDWSYFLFGTSIIRDSLKTAEKFFLGDENKSNSAPRFSLYIAKRREDGLLFNGGGGATFSLGYRKGRSFSFDVILGRSPYNDLSIKLATDWHVLIFKIPRKDPVAQIYVGIGNSITLYLDTYADSYKHFEFLASITLPIGAKYFFQENFDIFFEVLPRVGFITQSLFINTTTTSQPYGIYGSDLYSCYGFGITLGLHYWFI